MSNTRKRILIVDDDFDYLSQLKLQIEGFGHEVMTADSLKNAELTLETEKPDLAIYDLMMEAQDSGFVLAYKTKKKYPDVPVIIASAVTTDTGMIFHLETQSDHNWIKADRYLEKGIRGDQLHREINKLLKI